MTKYRAPRGMRDFYPEDFAERQVIFDAWRTAAEAHGFLFYDAPIVETMELLERKAGEEISEQIYTFVDKSDRRLALRPELTPSLARMIIARQKALTFPLKWTSIAQCFRYERMMRGRTREHYQWNLDVVGEEAVTAEAEVILTAVEVLRSLGLSNDDFRVHVGSRALLGHLLTGYGIDQEHLPACFVALDKRGKTTDAEIAGMLSHEGLPQTGIDQVIELLSIRSLDQVAARVDPNLQAISDLHEFFEVVAAMGISDCVVFDISIIRGLGYYSGIVFEAFDTKQSLRAIFGGGRYDNLLSSLGGTAVPAVGLGFGDVVLTELLRDHMKSLHCGAKIDYAIGFMSLDSRHLAIRVSSLLRAAGSNCDMALSPERAKAFFKRANKRGAQKAIYIGPDEVASGRLSVKNMQSSEESEMALAELGMQPDNTSQG